MTQASAYEQYLLELINVERGKVGAQPLAFDDNLNTAAEGHSSWMLAADVFSHDGANGTTPNGRMQNAGYVFTGYYSWGENIAWVSTGGAAGYQDEVQQLETNLMNSAPHRANLLNAGFREVGLGLEIGSFQSWNAAMLTEDFAAVSGNPFLTGVAFDDKDGDRFYDVGEGLANVTVNITNLATGATTSTLTQDAGGYQTELAAGTYSVTFSASGYSPTTSTVSIGANNVKLDWIDPTTSGGGTLPTQPTQPDTPAPATTGTSRANTFGGTELADIYDGLGGNDVIRGLGGHDSLTGGAGNDSIYGGLGQDTLTGGSGSDDFFFDTAPAADNIDRITDFAGADDIVLARSVFTAFTKSGSLASAAFWKGAEAHDASDRIIYDPTTGAVFYDPDGTGAAAQVHFADLATNLHLTASNFLIA
jgi:Ca2+-binding RTX toxin-like protein